MSEIVRKDDGEITILVLPSSKEPCRGDELKQVLLGLHMENRHQIILDMSQVAIITSSFLGVLLGATNRTRPHNGNIKLFGLQPRVCTVFQLTRLARIYEIFVDLESAVKSFGFD